MQPTFLNQELARVRHAEALREASRRHAVLRQQPDTRPRESRAPRVRLFARLRPTLGIA